MNILELFKPIRTFVFDMDGVMTDGTLQVWPDGNLVRTMNIKDGYALKMAVNEGYRVIVLSGAKSKDAVSRLQALGITSVFTGVENKKEKLLQLDINFSQTLYMGDDIPDYEAMKLVALPTCPADAVAEIKQISQYISSRAGGNGCVREVIEKVLKLNAHWPI